MMNRIRSLPRRTTTAVRRHPIATALCALASLMWLACGFVIGGAPFFAVTWLAVLLGARIGTRLVARRLGATKRDAEFTPPQARSARRDGVIVVATTAVVALGVFGLIQLVPFGRPQTYAAGSGEPAWSSPRTRELMVAACFDCHSNEVRYPWYSSVAPISWTVQHHIDEGHEAVNYSEFATNPGDAEDSIEVIREGSMPPSYFTAFGMHPEARLSEAEKAELIAGLEATPGLRAGSGDR